MPIGPSENWRCVRCGFELPSPEGGRAPISCLKEIGGCGRSTEDCEHGPDCNSCHTRFFPADWPRDKVELYIEEDLKEGARLFRDIVAEIERYIEFQKPYHSKLCALMVLESYIARPVLPTVFYLGFVGAVSSGKTTILEVLRDYCWRGKLSGEVSVAAASRLLHNGCTMLVDEADQMDDEKKDILFGSARRGYRRGSTRIITEGKNHDPKEIEIFGVYAFSFQTEVDLALQSRMITIPMARVRQDTMKEKVLSNLARLMRRSRMETFRRRIQECADNSLKDWTEERVAEVLEGAWLEGGTLSERIDRLAGIPDLPRDMELSAVMLLIGEVLGIDIIEETRIAFDSQERPSDPILEELADWVRSRFQVSIDGQEKPAIDRSERFEVLRRDYNNIRVAQKDKPFDGKQFRRLLLELGLREGRDMELRHPKNRSVVVYTTYLDQKLSAADRPETSPSLLRHLTLDAETGNPEGLRVTPQVRSQDERVRSLRERGLALWDSEVRSARASTHPPPRGLTLDALVAGMAGLEPAFEREEVEKLIAHLKNQGIVFEPKNGEYRFI